MTGINGKHLRRLVGGAVSALLVVTSTVVAANSEGVINVRALKPGRYEFYDDFNDKARGALTVQ